MRWVRGKWLIDNGHHDGDFPIHVLHVGDKKVMEDIRDLFGAVDALGDKQTGAFLGERRAVREHHACSPIGGCVFWGRALERGNMYHGQIGRILERR